MKKKLLVFDLDNTLIGKEHDLALSSEFNLKLNFDDFVIVYASGRSVHNMKEHYIKNGLISPHYLIGNVGTEIYDVEDRAYLNQYVDRHTTLWERKILRQIMRLLPFEMQEEKYQYEYKLSYKHNGDSDPIPLILRELQVNNAVCNLIFSEGKNIDLIPIRMSKGQAVRYLANYLVENKILEAIKRITVYVFGDSMNDYDMFKTGYRGVIVNNAEEGLKALVNRINYLSPYDDMKGVMDGLKHWRLI